MVDPAAGTGDLSGDQSARVSMEASTLGSEDLLLFFQRQRLATTTHRQKHRKRRERPLSPVGALEGVVQPRLRAERQARNEVLCFGRCCRWYLGANKAGTISERVMGGKAAYIDCTVVFSLPPLGSFFLLSRTLYTTAFSERMVHTATRTNHRRV